MVAVENERLARPSSVRHDARCHDLVAQTLLTRDHHYGIGLAAPLYGVAVGPFLAPLGSESVPKPLKTAAPILFSQPTVGLTDQGISCRVNVLFGRQLECF